MQEEDTANQMPEGGVQEEEEVQANQTVEDGTLQGDASVNEEDDERKVSVKAVMAETKKRQEAEARLEAERQARQAAEQQAAMIRQQFMTQQNPEPQIADDEYLTAGQVRAMAAHQSQQMQYSMFLSQHPDTAQIVGQGVGTGALQPSEHLQKALQANPSLYQLQAAAGQGNSAALQVLYMQAAAQKQISETNAELNTLRAAAAANAEQQAAIAAKTGVTSPLSAGGGGAVAGGPPDPNTPEGEAYWERMKAGEFD